MHTRGNREFRATGSHPRRLVFVTMGLDLPGGVANLSGSMVAALDSMVADSELDRVDVVSYLDSEPPKRHGEGFSDVAGGSRSRFLGKVWQANRRVRPHLIIFDHIGTARATRFPPIRSQRVPFAVMVHDPIDLDPIRRGNLIPIVNSSNFIIANSTTTSARVDTISPGTGPKVTVIHPPVSRSRITQWSSIDPVPYEERSNQVLIVGRMDATQPGKGHLGLLEAWPTVLGHHPDARLIVVGEGDDRPNLEATVQRLGIGHAVHFTGSVSDDQLGKLYATSVVYAMPSRQEGFGIVYAEAMWHGLPCIASTADAGSDVVDDGSTGLLVEYGNTEAIAAAVVTLLDDRTPSQQMGAAGRAKCLALYTPDAHREALRRTLMGPTPSSGPQAPI